jgi:copper homeostasis protein
MIEICCGSYQDGLAAYRGGAKRIELNSALSVGGLTPSLSSLIRLKKETDLKVICMVRSRAAGFCFDKEDVEIQMMDAKLMLENGADGIAFGFLNEDGTVDLENTKRMVDLVHFFDKEAVFHRAFDVTKDPFKAIHQLIEMGANRILTSGQKSKAIEGKELIKQLQAQYGSRIEILAGSGINYINAKEIMEYTGISQVHSSCKNYKTDPTTKSDDVSYSYLSKNHEFDYDVVDVKLVKELVNSIK